MLRDGIHSRDTGVYYRVTVDLTRLHMLRIRTASRRWCKTLRLACINAEITVDPRLRQAAGHLVHLVHICC